MKSVDINIQSISVDTYNSLKEISEEQWNYFSSIYSGMRYNLLTAVERSKVNEIRHFYLRFYEPGMELGRGNLYLTKTDLSTMDSDLTDVRGIIKSWYPDFMTFNTLECGYFTMFGEGVITDNPMIFPVLLEKLVGEMGRLSKEHNADIQVIRDVPLAKYEMYRDILMPSGYYPALGFANTELQVTWESLDEYLAELKSTTRNKLRNSIKFNEKFGIEAEILTDYKEYIPDILRLWLNVHHKTEYYKRENYNRRFFTIMEEDLKDSNEILIFKHNNKMIGFMLSLYDETRYLPMIWGVDYHYVYEVKANLYRAATMLCLKRAIELKKTTIEFGVTNYEPKLYIGLEAVPLIYFIKHNNNPDYSKTLAYLINKSIDQPDNFSHSPFKSPRSNKIDFFKLRTRIKNDVLEVEERDIFHRVESYEKMNVMKMAHIYNIAPEFMSAQNSTVSLNGRDDVVLLGTNSYLGAATDPDVMRATREAVTKYGTGCSGSPLLNGTLDIHKRLEEELADFIGREEVMLCSTGYQTNLAGISALCKPGDVIIMDKRNHRSLFDGARLSGAHIVLYNHNDMAHLEKILIKTESKPKIIVTDSVFSMEGTIANLVDICALGRKYGARIFVDEAHAVGVLGANGRGACELLGVEEQVDVIMCTFSKSFASTGGFLAGNKRLIDYIRHNAGAHIFSASLPPSAVMTVRAVLKLLMNNPGIGMRILDTAEFMADSLREMGYDARYHGTQIVPVVFGHEVLAFAAYKKFMEDGVFVNPVGPPAVPKNESGFRTSYIASHSRDDLVRALAVFKKNRRFFK